MDDHDATMRRLAENQAIFREVNERVEELNETFEQFTPFGSWACECAITDCVARIDLTLAEYERIRTTPTHFAVFPADAHVFPEVEVVRAKTDRYWIVEKVGAGAEVAANLDPRRGH